MNNKNCVIVRTFKNDNLIAEKIYAPETSLIFIKAKIKELLSKGLKFQIICRSDFVIEEIES